MREALNKKELADKEKAEKSKNVPKAEKKVDKS